MRVETTSPSVWIRRVRLIGRAVDERDIRRRVCLPTTRVAVGEERVIHMRTLRLRRIREEPAESAAVHVGIAPAEETLPQRLRVVCPEKHSPAQAAVGGGAILDSSAVEEGECVTHHLITRVRVAQCFRIRPPTLVRRGAVDEAEARQGSECVDGGDHQCTSMVLGFINVRVISVRYTAVGEVG